MEEPEDSEADGQRKEEETGERVAEVALGSEAKEEFEIRREGADDERRKNKAGAPERKCGSSVSEGKRHSF